MPVSINQKRLQETFFELVRYDTGSDSASSTAPSTQKQLALAEILAQKLRSLGLENVNLSKSGVVTGTLHGSLESDIKIGFIAHMDTSPDYSGAGIKPNIITDYNGSDIVLKDGIIISPNPSYFLKIT